MIGLRIDQLVFLDETWTKTNFTRSRAAGGWSRRCRTVTADFVLHRVANAGDRVRGGAAQLGFDRALVVDGPIDGRLFLAYVQQHLAPTLRPGDIVVRDHLSSHKVAGVRQAIEGVGVQVAYLPPYSPDFNPIEQVFAKLKLLVRSAKQRTVEGLWSRLGQLLDRFPAAECRNYIRHGGYATES